MKRISRSVCTAAGIIIVAACTVPGPGPARADGGFLPPYGFPVYEPGQTAFIRHDSATSTEELSILPRFRGEPTDFAWVVPVPALPEVAEADPDLFRQLDELTRPLRRSRDSFWNCMNADYAVSDAAERGNGGVEIIDEQLIGIYRTMVLGAADADALVDSLTAWGFLHEGNLETVAPLLQAYVDDGWYFVTMTIDSTAVAAAGWPYGKAATTATIADAPYYWYPSLQPVTFTFASAEIVYPLRISRISAWNDNAVNLYVAADHRVEFPGSRTLYANRLSAGEAAAVARLHPQAAAGLPTGTFLTRLERSYTAEQMDQDLVLSRAASDAEFLPIIYSGIPVWSLAWGGSVVWWLAHRRRRRPR